MSDQPSNPAQKEPADSPNATQKTKTNKKTPITPTLAAFFDAKPIPPGPYFKALRAAKTDRFTNEDIAAANTLAAEIDANGARLLQLAAQPKKPKPIERWIWPATQAFLRSKIPAALEPYEPSADAAFRRVHQELQRGLCDSDTVRRQQAEIMLALSLTWLASQRTLDVVGTLEHLRDSFAATDAATRETVRKALIDGKVSTLKRVAAVATLLGNALRDSRASLEAERQRRAALETQINETKAKVAALASQIEDLIKERDRIAAEAADAVRKLDEGRQHAGHDIVDLKAQQAKFLKQRMTPLLNDAVDALEIDPPAPQIAIARVKAAIDAIGDATG